MTETPAESRPDNLFEPVTGDHGAHGRFDERSTSWSPVAWAGLNRGWVVGAVLAAGALGLWVARRRR